MVIYMKAINNNVILEKISVESTMSGIILNSVSKNTAKVVSCSDGISILKTGDIVVYNTGKATEFEHEGKKYLVIDINNILVVL